MSVRHFRAYPNLVNLTLQVWLMFILVIVTASAFLRNDTILHMLISSWFGWAMQIVGFVLFDKVVTPKHDLTELLSATKVSPGIAVCTLFVALGVLAAVGVA